ncbi:uncharacterized protein LOC116305650 [Actinia tenebrosa]|uniref:Autophagy-related protein 27 n=1 Tax=Actinia tenebrosa TaxID=6105 RepID=A0A6P8J0P3_ACTTE|nr:uncharacterized protein LOC116305650 [Actinia tenebrosa]
MAFFRRRAGSVARIFFISLVVIPIVLAKTCKKLSNCKCELDDGSVIDLSDLDNKDGKPRFTDIPEEGQSYTYKYNPCTPIKLTGEDSACTGANLCQRDPQILPPSYYPCDASNPSFTVDESNHVVMTYKSSKDSYGYTRTTKVTLLCDEEQKKGSTGKGVSQTPGLGPSSTYSLTLSAKSACPASSSLSTGSILLIIFFPLVLLYLIFGILFNVFIRHKQSVPDVLPNHTFWADFPFLVKSYFMRSCPNQMQNSWPAVTNIGVVKFGNINSGGKEVNPGMRYFICLRS